MATLVATPNIERLLASQLGAGGEELALTTIDRDTGRGPARGFTPDALCQNDPCERQDHRGGHQDESELIHHARDRKRSKIDKPIIPVPSCPGACVPGVTNSAFALAAIFAALPSGWGPRSLVTHPGGLANAHMATTKPQQRGSIIDAKDLRYFIRIASKNWYFVVVALLLSAVLSYLYSYKLPDIHGATTQILLKDNEVYDYQSQMYKSLGYVQSYSDIVNQKRVITSYDLIDATLDKLDFDISYFIVGRFKTTQVYGGLPFKVNFDVLDPKLYDRPMDFQVLDSTKYELSFDRNGKLEKFVFQFDQEVKDPGNQFVLKVEPFSVVRVWSVRLVRTTSS